MSGASVKGINWLGFGVTDNSGKILLPENGGIGNSGVFIVDGDGEGATTANITGLEEKGTAQYANNKVKRTAHGAPTPTVAITMLDINYQALMSLKGYNYDGKGGYVLNNGQKPHVALMICSSDFKGNYVYDCFANGEVIEVAHNHGTNNKNETDYNTTLEYDAVDPIGNSVFLDDHGVQAAYKQFFEADKDFDYAKMFAEVFGGYVLDDATKQMIGAKTKTPTPAAPSNQPVSQQ